MNLDIEIDKRNKGFFFHKNKGIKSTLKAKYIAFKDITQECGENKFYTKNYVSSESQVLDMCKKILIIIELDTTKY